MCLSGFDSPWVYQALLLQSFATKGVISTKNMLSLDGGEFWVCPGSNSPLDPVEISKLEALAELGGAELQQWGRNRQIHTGNVD